MALRRGPALRSRLPSGAPRGALGAALLLAGACRDAPEPFVAPEPPTPQVASRQVTFNLGDDRAPAWSESGDTIYYTGEGFDVLQRTEGLLLAIPANGGTARPLLPSVQTVSAPARAFLTPAVEPGGRRIAYAHKIRILAPGATLCGGSVACQPADPSMSRLPRLERLVLRVRDLAATGPIEADPELAIDFPGKDFDDTVHPFNLSGVHVIDVFPFHTVFNEDETYLFRPSWSPAGGSLVVSDGSRLLSWDPSGGAVSPIPNTEDAISAAWSPDGTWIAFTRLERGTGVTSQCQHSSVGRGGQIFVSCIERRTVFPILRRTVSLIRPDGSGRVDITDGVEPAWGPDSRTLYFRRAGRIWRISVDGTGEAAVGGTVGGREPAVSPDGSRLAFARPDASGKHDIWIVSLGR